MRFIITFILILFAIRTIARLIFPPLIKSIVKKTAEKMQQNQGFQEPSKPEGTVTIDKNINNNSTFNSKGNDTYVDYEEIK